MARMIGFKPSMRVRQILEERKPTSAASRSDWIEFLILTGYDALQSKNKDAVSSIEYHDLTLNKTLFAWV